MDIEEIRNLCLSFPGVTESFPFDNSTLVFKVGSKMFLLMSLENQPLQFNVKCDPEEAISLREQFDYVLPGYHMNKTHWNTIIVDPNAHPRQLSEWITNSYELVKKSLPKKERDLL